MSSDRQPKYRQEIQQVSIPPPLRPMIPFGKLEVSVSVFCVVTCPPVHRLALNA